MSGPKTRWSWHRIGVKDGPHTGSIETVAGFEADAEKIYGNAVDMFAATIVSRIGTKCM